MIFTLEVLSLSATVCLYEAYSKRVTMKLKIICVVLCVLYRIDTSNAMQRPATTPMSFIDTVARYYAQRLITHDLQEQLKAIRSGALLPEDVIACIKRKLIDCYLVELIGIFKPFMRPITIINNNDNAAVIALSFAGNSKSLMIGLENNTIRTYDLLNQVYTGQLRGVPYALTNMVISSSQNYALIRTEEGKLLLWALKDNQVTCLLERNSCVDALAFSADETLALYGITHGAIYLRDLYTQVVRHYEHNNISVRWLALGPDNNFFASNDNNALLRVWNAAKNTSFSQGSLQGFITSAIWHPNGKDIMLIKWGKHSIMCDVVSDTIKDVAYAGALMSATFSPDGLYLLGGAEDNSVKIWNLHTLQSEQLAQNAQVVYAVAWSPDGTTCATSAFDNTVSIWPLVAFMEQFTLEQLVCALKLRTGDPKTILAQPYYAEVLESFDSRELKESLKINLGLHTYL